MRRNPRPFRPVDRRRLVIESLEREARSPVLNRLIEEVRNEDPAHPRTYDRAHRRHNRS